MGVEEFDIIRGTSQQFIAYLKKEDGSALDLTGNSAMALYVGATRNSSSLALSKTLALYSTAGVGAVYYTFVPSDTSSASTGDYVAEVHITYASGAEYRTKQPFVFRIIERVKA